MTHLTFTGYHAGTLLCGAARTPQGSYAHAIYAPLHLPHYVEQVCKDCLRVWRDADPVEDDESHSTGRQ